MASTKILKLKCLLVLALLGILSVASYLIMKTQIQTEQSAAAMINVSGRQRMLSQRTAWFSLQLIQSQDKSQREKLRADLSATINLLEKSHNGLIHGNPAMSLPGNLSPQVRSIYFDPPILLNTQIKNYLQAVKSLAHAPESELTQDNPHLNYILTEARVKLLSALDRIVKQYQMESETNIAGLGNLETGVTGVALLVILGVWLFIFRPMVSQIKRETTYTQLLKEVAFAANEAGTVREVMQIGLDQVCTHIEWPIGHICTYAKDLSGGVISSGIWHLEDPERFKTFKEVSKDTRFASGEGLPGRVLASGKPAWITDVTQESNFPRTKLTKDLGVRTGFAFPIMAGKEVVAVMEFFSAQTEEPDERLLEVMANVGTQIGLVIERNRAKTALEKARDELEIRVRNRTKALRDANRALTNANEEVKIFAYIVSHDLRSPLVNLKGFANELSFQMEIVRSALTDVLPHLDEKKALEVKTALVDKVPQALRFIKTATERMDRLINSVLKLSRLGHRELIFQPINTNNLVKKVVDSLAHQIEEKEIRVTVNPLPEVDTDLIALEQIFSNILTNAVQYLDPSRPGEIEISAENTEQEITFHIRDNGRGIADEEMHKVFEIFRRAGKQDVAGEGMGLAYVKTLIHRHGGEITCQSKLGVGSTFSFTLSKSLKAQIAVN